jgi:tetratricopeptide (TPR) repeat protein
MPRESTKNKDYGVPLRERRRKYGDPKQEVFALLLGVPRGTYSLIETGKRRPNDKLLDGLIRLFPDEAQQILDEARPYRASSKQPRLPTRYADIEKLAREGELDKAWQELDRSGFALDHLGRAELCLNLNDICRECHFPRISKLSRIPGWTLLDLAHGYLINAYALQAAARSDKRLLALWERLVDAHLQEDCYESAYDLLEDALDRYHTAGKLWYTRALLLLGVGQFSDAEASLTMATAHNASKLDVVFARGLLFTAWEKPTEAIVDLSRALEDPKLASAHAARARSARAFALLTNKQITEALDEFAAIEQDTPDNAWRHYYWGLQYEPTYDCGRAINKDKQAEYAQQALQCFGQALACAEYPLTSITRKWVERRLAGEIRPDEIVDEQEAVQIVNSMR